jgi:glycosyltransferase involved in cell wall biosynthesis
MIDAGFKHIVLVDDGSSEGCKEPFRKALAEHPECRLVVHEVNKGKGRALRDAFAYVAENIPDAEAICGYIPETQWRRGRIQRGGIRDK